jgi:hypothetical protein
MKVNLKQISTLVLLLGLTVGCKEEVPEKDHSHKGQHVAHTSQMLVGQVIGDQLTSVMTDPVLLETLFREDYPYASENLVISKQAFKTYQPFQIEYDDLNAHGRRIYYLTALAEDKISKKPMFMRIELSQKGNSLYLDPDGSTVMHIHTCSPKGAPSGQKCDFLFTERGFYDGCSCGGDVAIFDSRLTDF